MADGIHEFTATHGCQKKRSEKLVISWIAGACSQISDEKIKSSFLKSIQNMIFFYNIVKCDHFLCLLLTIFFSFSKCSPKLGCTLYTGKYSDYLQQIIHFFIKTQTTSLCCWQFCCFDNCTEVLKIYLNVQSSTQRSGTWRLCKVSRSDPIHL